jgi:hypothetical protein
MLSTLVRALQLAGLNAVPLGAAALSGGTLATALVLYWWENLVGGAFVALRIALHRARTGTRGHYRPHLGLQMQGKLRVAGRVEPVDVAPKTLLAEFAWSAGAFTLAQGVLLALLLGKLLPDGEVARATSRGGLAAVVLLQGLGFALDLPRLGSRPFLWVKTLAERSLGRVVLVQLAILAGAVLAAGRPDPLRFLLPFAVAKTVSDLASWLPLQRYVPDPERAPGWARRLARLAPRRGRRFEDHWREAAERERRLAAEDEEPVDARG